MLAYTLLFIDRQILSLLVQPIKAELQISDTQAGLLQGFAFALFYIVVGLPMGRIVDRHNRRNLISAGAFSGHRPRRCGRAGVPGELNPYTKHLLVSRLHSHGSLCIQYMKTVLATAQTVVGKDL